MNNGQDSPLNNCDMGLRWEGQSWTESRCYQRVRPEFSIVAEDDNQNPHEAWQPAEIMTYFHSRKMDTHNPFGDSKLSKRASSERRHGKKARATHDASKKKFHNNKIRKIKWKMTVSACFDNCVNCEEKEEEEEESLEAFGEEGGECVNLSLWLGRRSFWEWFNTKSLSARVHQPHNTKKRRRKGRSWMEGKRAMAPGSRREKKKKKKKVKNVFQFQIVTNDDWFKVKVMRLLEIVVGEWRLRGEGKGGNGGRSKIEKRKRKKKKSDLTWQLWWSQGVLLDN